jgi:metal-responsive CopG/Arc/MetJ family transcriptional regulator
MVNITISIPEELSKKMKRHSEVKWSEVVRKALANYVDTLEMVEGGVVSAEALSKKLKEKCIDVSTVDLDQAIKYYEEGRKLERKRLSMIQASS